AGSRRWFVQQGILPGTVEDTGMCVHVALDGRYAGRVRFRESLQPEAAATVAALATSHCETWLLSGDTAGSCRSVAAALGIPASRVRSGQSPEDKRDFLETAEMSGPVLFVGDGMNDGLALATAKLGVAVADADPTARAAAAVLLPGERKSTRLNSSHV